MALINKESLLCMVLRELSKTEKPGGVELLSYKRNRAVVVVKMDHDMYLVIQNGYGNEEVVISWGQLQRKLKVLLKKEFPRSRKVRFNRFPDFEKLNRSHQII